MTPLRILTKTIVIAIVGAAAMFLGMIFFTFRMMGDRTCPISIQNSSEKSLRLVTIPYYERDKTTHTDTVDLTPGEKLEIGRCISCNRPEPSDLDYSGIAFYENGGWQTFREYDLLNRLEQHDKTDCITYHLK